MQHPPFLKIGSLLPHRFSTKKKRTSNNRSAPPHSSTAFDVKKKKQQSKPRPLACAAPLPRATSAVRHAPQFCHLLVLVSHPEPRWMRHFFRKKTPEGRPCPSHAQTNTHTELTSKCFSFKNYQFYEAYERDSKRLKIRHAEKKWRKNAHFLRGNPLGTFPNNPPSRNVFGKEMKLDMMGERARVNVWIFNEIL